MKKLLLKNANVLDGTKDMTVKENVDILISGENIERIDKNIDSSDAEVIDLAGAYVTPGLINMHVHLPASGKISKKKVADKTGLVKFIGKNRLTKEIGVAICAKYAKVELLSGVTTVRTVGGVSSCDAILRDKINNNKKIGPRLLVANTAIGIPHGHMDGTVAIGANSNEEAVKLVEKQYNDGADLIKLMITGGVLDTKERGNPGVLKMNGEMVKACCDKAHELGLKVAAHVEGPEGIRVAVLNGVDTIEHGSEFDADIIDGFKERNGALICTLSPAVPLSKLDPSVTGYSEDCQYNTNVLLARIKTATEECLKKGILVGLGTDTACPFVTHYDMWRELVYYTKYIDGITPSFALHSATLVNAKIAGIDNVTGSVEVGKSADLLVVNKNPLEDLTVLRDPKLVIFKGRKYTEKNEKYSDVEAILDGIM